MSYRVLVTSRSFGEVSGEPEALLTENGFSVWKPEKKGLMEEEELCRLLPDCDAMIIGAEKLTARAMDCAPRLRIVCKHGTGLDNIDLEAARAHGICVKNVPAVNAVAVAETAVGLMLDVSRKISYAASLVKKGGWERCIGQSLAGKRLGIVGLGKIGREVAVRAHSFAMEITAYDPACPDSPRELPFVRMAPLSEILSQSDVITLHLPLTEKTRGMISAEQMDQMKPGAILINTARGGIVNEDDLYRYVKSGRLGGAGLDVTVQEPPAGSPLLTLDNVVVLPHMASYSRESLNAISLICVENIIRLFQNV